VARIRRAGGKGNAVLDVAYVLVTVAAFAVLTVLVRAVDKL
jgi:hypothetical protein